MDAKADRKKGQLDLINLYFEPDFDQIDSFLPVLGDKLGKFAHFNDCKKVHFINDSSNKITTELKSILLDVSI